MSGAGRSERGGKGAGKREKKSSCPARGGKVCEIRKHPLLHNPFDDMYRALSPGTRSSHATTVFKTTVYDSFTFLVTGL